MSNDPLGAQEREPAESEHDSAGGGCHWLEMGVSYTELGCLWGRVTDAPDNGMGSAATADGVLQHPRVGGLELPELQLMDDPGMGQGLDPSPSSRVPRAAAHQGPTGLFWCFRVSFPASRAHHAGRLHSPQWLLPPCAALLAVHSHHLRCLQPHLPHFCHVSEPQLSGQGWPWAGPITAAP